MKGVLLKNGNYYIDYRLTNGKRRRKKIGQSKKLAETVLSKIKVEIAEGKHLDVVKKDQIKFEDFAQEYFNCHSRQHKKGWKTDKYIMNVLNRFFKGKCLYEITPKDIENFKMERINERINDKPLSPATVNRQLDLLSGMFNKAIAWGKLRDNPMKSVSSFRVSPGRLRFLEKEEVIKLISNCSDFLRPVVIVAVFTGMRKSEILGLKWHDIDIKRSIITLLDTKNGEKREVPMSEIVKNALIKVRKHPESPYIFWEDNGKCVHDVRKSFSTALRKSGINNFRFHDLRHTFASQLVMSGVDLNTVRELLGHKDMTMTLRYSHLAQSHKQWAVDTLQKRMDTFWTLEENNKTTPKFDLSQLIENEVFELTRGVAQLASAQRSGR